MAVVLRVPNVDDPDFVASVELDDNRPAQLALIGSVDSIATRELATLLQKLHAQLVKLGTREIIVDMRELDFMASSGVRELLAWFATLESLPEAERYRIRLRSNAAIAWQRHTLPALSCFDTALVVVEGDA
jgi:hypothetical protein